MCIAVSQVRPLSVFVVVVLFVFFFFAALPGILVPQPGIKPVSLVMQDQGLNSWTAGEVRRPLSF